MIDWDLIYVDLIRETGWTWDHLDNECDLRVVNAFLRRWQVVPPMQRLFAQWVGFKPKNKQASEVKEVSPEDAKMAARSMFDSMAGSNLIDG